MTSVRLHRKDTRNVGNSGTSGSSASPAQRPPAFQGHATASSPSTTIPSANSTTPSIEGDDRASRGLSSDTSSQNHNNNSSSHQHQQHRTPYHVQRGGCNDAGRILDHHSQGTSAPSAHGSPVNPRLHLNYHSFPPHLPPQQGVGETTNTHNNTNNNSCCTGGVKGGCNVGDTCTTILTPSYSSASTSIPSTSTPMAILTPSGRKGRGVRGGRGGINIPGPLPLPLPSTSYTFSALPPPSSPGICSPPGLSSSPALSAPLVIGPLENSVPSNIPLSREGTPSSHFSGRRFLPAPRGGNLTKVPPPGRGRPSSEAIAPTSLTPSPSSSSSCTTGSASKGGRKNSNRSEENGGIGNGKSVVPSSSSPLPFSSSLPPPPPPLPSHHHNAPSSKNISHDNYENSKISTPSISEDNRRVPLLDSSGEAKAPLSPDTRGGRGVAETTSFISPISSSMLYSPVLSSCTNPNGTESGTSCGGGTTTSIMSTSSSNITTNSSNNNNSSTSANSVPSIHSTIVRTSTRKRRQDHHNSPQQWHRKGEEVQHVSQTGTEKSSSTISTAKKVTSERQSEPSGSGSKGSASPTSENKMKMDNCFITTNSTGGGDVKHMSNIRREVLKVEEMVKRKLMEESRRGEGNSSGEGLKGEDVVKGENMKNRNEENDDCEDDSDVLAYLSDPLVSSLVSQLYQRVVTVMPEEPLQFIIEQLRQHELQNQPPRSPRRPPLPPVLPPFFASFSSSASPTPSVSTTALLRVPSPTPPAVLEEESSVHIVAPLSSCKVGIHSHQGFTHPHSSCTSIHTSTSTDKTTSPSMCMNSSVSSVKSREKARTASLPPDMKIAPPSALSGISHDEPPLLAVEKKIQNEESVNGCGAALEGQQHQQQQPHKQDVGKEKEKGTVFVNNEVIPFSSISSNLAVFSLSASASSSSTSLPRSPPGTAMTVMGRGESDKTRENALELGTRPFSSSSSFSPSQGRSATKLDTEVDHALPVSIVPTPSIQLTSTGKSTVSSGNNGNNMNNAPTRMNAESLTGHLTHSSPMLNTDDGQSSSPPSSFSATTNCTWNGGCTISRDKSKGGCDPRSSGSGKLGQEDEEGSGRGDEKGAVELSSSLSQSTSPILRMQSDSNNSSTLSPQQAIRTATVRGGGPSLSCNEPSSLTSSPPFYGNPATVDSFPCNSGSNSCCSSTNTVALLSLPPSVPPLQLATTSTCSSSSPSYTVATSPLPPARVPSGTVRPASFNSSRSFAIFDAGVHGMSSSFNNNFGSFTTGSGNSRRNGSGGSGLIPLEGLKSSSSELSFASCGSVDVQELLTDFRQAEMECRRRRSSSTTDTNSSSSFVATQEHHHHHHQGRRHPRPRCFPSLHPLVMMEREDNCGSGEGKVSADGAFKVNSSTIMEGKYYTPIYGNLFYGTTAAGDGLMLVHPPPPSSSSGGYTTVAAAAAAATPDATVYPMRAAITTLTCDSFQKGENEGKRDEQEKTPPTMSSASAYNSSLINLDDLTDILDRVNVPLPDITLISALFDELRLPKKGLPMILEGCPSVKSSSKGAGSGSCGGGSGTVSCSTASPPSSFQTSTVASGQGSGSAGLRFSHSTTPLTPHSMSHSDNLVEGNEGKGGAAVAATAAAPGATAANLVGSEKKKKKNEEKREISAQYNPAAAPPPPSPSVCFTPTSLGTRSSSSLQGKGNRKTNGGKKPILSVITTSNSNGSKKVNNKRSSAGDAVGGEERLPSNKKLQNKKLCSPKGSVHPLFPGDDRGKEETKKREENEPPKRREKMCQKSTKKSEKLSSGNEIEGSARGRKGRKGSLSGAPSDASHTLLTRGNCTNESFSRTTSSSNLSAASSMSTSSNSSTNSISSSSSWTNSVNGDTAKRSFSSLGSYSPASSISIQLSPGMDMVDMEQRGGSGDTGGGLPDTTGMCPTTTKPQPHRLRRHHHRRHPHHHHRHGAAAEGGHHHTCFSSTRWVASGLPPPTISTTFLSGTRHVMEGVESRMTKKIKNSKEHDDGGNEKGVEDESSQDDDGEDDWIEFDTFLARMAFMVQGKYPQGVMRSVFFAMVDALDHGLSEIYILRKSAAQPHPPLSPSIPCQGRHRINNNNNNNDDNNTKGGVLSTGMPAPMGTTTNTAPAIPVATLTNIYSANMMTTCSGNTNNNTEQSQRTVSWQDCILTALPVWYGRPLSSSTPHYGTDDNPNGAIASPAQHSSTASRITSPPLDPGTSMTTSSSSLPSTLLHPHSHTPVLLPPLSTPCCLHDSPANSSPVSSHNGSVAGPLHCRSQQQQEPQPAPHPTSNNGSPILRTIHETLDPIAIPIPPPLSTPPLSSVPPFTYTNCDSTPIAPLVKAEATKSTELLHISRTVPLYICVMDGIYRRLGFRQINGLQVQQALRLAHLPDEDLFWECHVNDFTLLVQALVQLSQQPQPSSSSSSTHLPTTMMMPLWSSPMCVGAAGSSELWGTPSGSPAIGGGSGGGRGCSQQ